MGMSGLIGKKIGMTSIFDENGKNVPCTVLEAGPCVVTQVRTEEVDGYKALQLGFDDKAEKRANKAETGHYKKAGTSPKKKVVEFQGFQGVVKRHGFGGVGQATHGQHNRLRAPGSIGAASYPSKVVKGLRMAGRMGGERVTVQNLKVLKVVPEKNLLVVKGCVPGHKNAYVTIQRWQ